MRYFLIEKTDIDVNGQKAKGPAPVISLRVRPEFTTDAGAFYLLGFKEDAPRLSELAATAGVVEIPNDQTVLPAKKLQAARALFASAKIAVGAKTKGIEIIAELKAAAKVKQTLSIYSPQERTELLARLQAQITAEA